jgi:hypothetical protein
VIDTAYCDITLEIIAMTAIGDTLRTFGALLA